MEDDIFRDLSLQFESLVPHIEELRRRLTIAVVAVLIGTVIAFVFAGRIIEFLAEPVGGLQGLQAIELTENLGVYVRVSLAAGAILAMPVIVYEVVAFIVPGLTDPERLMLYVSLPFVALSFLAGAAFAYFIMLPVAIPFLVDFSGIPTVPRTKDYVSFVTRVVFWIGVAFETPLVIALLARIGIVTPEMLIRNWRIAFVIVAVLAALITPTIDPVNMAIVMGPLLGLYGISIILAKIMYRPRVIGQTPEAAETDVES
ncbi:MAG: twin-arginine translocase subunit TatC [Chloroflexota bacterium]|nr:twin-arginine translocase subunit TatC [Chloroflexota bacterium]